MTHVSSTTNQLDLASFLFLRQTNKFVRYISIKDEADDIALEVTQVSDG